MRFIGQFAVYPELFGQQKARLAYLFMTDGKTFVNGTWLPDGGENAVILQPGIWRGPLSVLRTGPTLFKRVLDGTTDVVEIPVEYAIELKVGNDPEVLDEDEFREHDAWDSYCDFLAESKLGGAPAFREYPENPEYLDANRWRLLLQINSALVPGALNFGDGGTGYLFISKSGDSARFLWQG